MDTFILAALSERLYGNYERLLRINTNKTAITSFLFSGSSQFHAKCQKRNLMPHLISLFFSFISKLATRMRILNPCNKKNETQAKKKERNCRAISLQSFFPIPLL